MSMVPTTLDWDVVQGRLAQYPRLAAVFAPWTTKGRRLGDHSIVLEWLNDGSPGCFARVASVESDLDTVAAAGLPGFGGLAARLGREGRDGTFGILAELFVGAWYLRSGVAVIDVHRDHGQGDVIIRDGDAVAHVEVYELSAPNNEYVWRDAWAELADRLKSMRLPCTVVVWGPPNVRWEQGPGHPYPVPVPVDPPDLTDIQAICRRVGETAPRLRPLRLQGSALSRKYPELWIELKDGPSYVIATGGWSGGSYSPSWVADRILAKVRPVAEGRAILVVEVYVRINQLRQLRRHIDEFEATRAVRAAAPTFAPETRGLGQRRLTLDPIRP